MNEPEFDIQAWLDHVADTLIATVPAERLHGDLTGPLPRQVKFAYATVTRVNEPGQRSVVFNATGSDGTEFRAQRLV